MIIAGNSQVTMFKSRKIISDKTKKNVSIYWVGPLTIDKFSNNHFSAQYIRQLFLNTDEWKFLSIGFHDYKILIKALTCLSHRDFILFLNHMIQQYKEIFLELNYKGKFGWLVNPQHRENLENYVLNDHEVSKWAYVLNDSILGWCRINQINVIDPLNLIDNPIGLKNKEYFATDGFHLNFLAAKIYLKKIEEITGEKFIINSKKEFRTHILIPRTKTDYMIMTIAKEIDLQWDQTNILFGEKEKFTQKILLFVSKLLKQKDIFTTINKHSDYIIAGQFNSMELIKIYTYATDLVGIDINFDVYIRHLNTVEKLSSFLLIKKPLTINDFFNSTITDITDDYNPTEIMFADFRIASIEGKLFNKFKNFLDNYLINTKNEYGIIFFWLSLIESHNNYYNKALKNLQKAIDTSLPNPFVSSRIDYYENCWKNKISAFEPLLEILRHKQLKNF